MSIASRLPTFATAAAVLRVAHSPHLQCSRTPPTAKKGGSGKKRGKTSRSKRAVPPPVSKPPTAPSSLSDPSTAAAHPPPAEAEPSLYPGPLAPELLIDVDVQPVDQQTPEESVDVNAEIEVADNVSMPIDAPLPVADEVMLKLPDLGAVAGAKGVKRKRKPRAVEGEEEVTNGERELGGDSEERLPTDRIRELTAAYRSGGKEAGVLINEIEKDPDYMFKTANPDGEYDLASAIMGTGSPNKQGVYVLPYLQSGHMLLVLVVLLCTFVYYPGFPLTELDDSLRLLLKRGLALTYFVNAGLAVLAYKDANKRGQPAAFWALKTAFLGNIALSELRRNVPMEGDERQQ